MALQSNLKNMAICLFGTCLICAALLGGVYALTAQPIKDANAKILEASVNAVLPEGGQLSDKAIISVGGQESEYYTSLKDGVPAAYAIKSAVTGFGGPLVLMVGITVNGVVYNTSVLSHSETPGLGAKCTSDEKFVAQWKGFNTAEKILKVKKDNGDVDAITASTITSRAYTLAVENAVKAMKTIGGTANE